MKPTTLVVQLPPDVRLDVEGTGADVTVTARLASHDHDDMLGHLVDEWGALGVLYQLLDRHTADQGQGLVAAASRHVAAKRGTEQDQRPTGDDRARHMMDDVAAEHALLWRPPSPGLIGDSLPAGERVQACPECGGAGWVHAGGTTWGRCTRGCPRPECETCEGRGWVPHEGHSAEHGIDPCPDCS